jgi:thiol-disulfide isomerase/thioredoxin
MRRAWWLSLGFVGLVACFDEDGDGLGNGAEKRLGTDPAQADSDGDGLSDGAEADEHATDPMLPDSDGDGYRDGDEVLEGADPLDEDDRIYTGGWPYNPNKDDLEDPGWNGDSKAGDPMPRFVWLDQFGEEVDFYDFGGQGKPIVLDISGVWCYYCREMAKWLEGRDSTYGSNFYPEVVEMVNNGDILWVTALDADAQQRPAELEDAEEWAEDYENPAVAVLVDEDQELQSFLNITGYPTVVLIEEDMTIALNPPNYTFVFDELLERREDGEL